MTLRRITRRLGRTSVLPRAFVSVLVVVALSSATAAEPPAIKSGDPIIVFLGKEHQPQTPLVRSVTVDKSLANSTALELVDERGRAFPAQLTRVGLAGLSKATEKVADAARELHFLLPDMSLRAPLKLTLQPSDAKPGVEQKTFAWHDTAQKHCELRFGQRRVLRYMYEALDESSPARRDETYKVYHHVYSPDGLQLLSKGPGGKFPHHRGLFFGFNKISYGPDFKQQADVWHCNRGEWQAHQRILHAEAGPVLGRHRLAIAWHGRDRKVFVEEERELTAYNTDGGTLIDFVSRLTSKVGTVRLDGDPQHAGFQFRASQEVPDHTAAKTYYLRPDGKDQPGKFRNWPGDKEHENLPWNALSFVLDRTRYTVVYLNHPDNPRPARYSERDYGRFGCYFPHELAADKPLVVRYRVWVQKGETTVERANALHRAFAKPADGSPVRSSG